MQREREYLKFINNWIEKKPEEIIAKEALKNFDKDFYRNGADYNDYQYLYAFLLCAFIDKYNIKNLQEQLEFLKKHFDKELCQDFSHFYIDNVDGIKYIKSFNDLKNIDTMLEMNHCEYFQSPIIYPAICNYFYYGYENRFETGEEEWFYKRLNLLDTIEPDKNHIPNFFKHLLPNFLEYSYNNTFLRYSTLDDDVILAKVVAEQLRIFKEFFSTEKLQKDNILKDYFTKKNYTDCLEILEENNSISLEEMSIKP